MSLFEVVDIDILKFLGKVLNILDGIILPITVEEFEGSKYDFDDFKSDLHIPTSFEEKISSSLSLDDASVNSSAGSTDSPATSSMSNSCDEIEAIREKSVTDTVLVTTSGKKKRKSYYIRKYPIPKLLKRDIRWDIPKLVTSVLNSRDDNLVSSFFHRICFPSCTFTDAVPKILGVSPEVVYDIDTMISIINIDLGAFPDLIMDLKQAQIVQHERFHGGSQIVLYYEMKGTKLYHNNQDRRQLCGSTDDLTNNGTVLSSIIPVPTDDMSTTPSPSVVHHVDYKVEDYVPLPQPMKVEMSPKISICLNEQNIAYAIEYSLLPGSEIVKTALERSFQQLCMA